MKQRKKILLVAPRLNLGGAETYVVTVALALKRAGYTIHVASAGGRLAKLLEREGIRQHFVPIRLNAALAAGLLTRIVDACAIDLIHANSAAAGIAAVKVKERRKIPVVYTAHGLFGHNAQEMTLKLCDKIICVSEAARQYQIERGFDPARLQTLYSGIDLDKFRPDTSKRAEIRQAFNIPPDTFVFALAARMQNLENKGHIDLLHILKKYPAAKAWRILMIGAGAHYFKYRYLVWKNQLSDQVRFTGQQVRVQDFVNAADALILPSRYETFGLVLAEAMAMEKPVVAYAVGGTTEVVGDETGCLVPYHDIDAFYQQMEWLSREPERAAQMGKAGRKWVAERFDSQRMARQLIQLYQTI